MSTRILVACYSYTGNTYKIARGIQAVTGARLSVIYPRQPYPMQFPKLLPQVREELRVGHLPTLVPGLPSTEDFDVLFIGTPNWCGTVSPPVSSYLATQHWEGKTVVPFYSHCGGWRGNIGEDMARLCPGANVLPDLGLVNDGGEALQRKLLSWLKVQGLEGLAEDYIA